MVARFLGVRVWELARVATHYQEEARVILLAQYEARMYRTDKGASGMAGAATIALPEF